MSIALMSLIALLAALAISCFLPYNVGMISIGFSFFVGILVAGMPASDILAGFPTNLFIILVGVTYLFSIAEVNGTLERVSSTCIRLVRGRASMIPWVFFVLAFVLSGIGPGNIPVTALLAPPAMVLASRMKISPFLMGIFVVHGAQAACMSPITPSGAIANGIISKYGLDLTWTLFRDMALANIIVVTGAYFAFGGLALLKRERDGAGLANMDSEFKAMPYERQHILSLIGIVALLIGALVLKFDVGLWAIVIGVILIILGCADENKVIKAMPWETLLMLCGVTILVGLLSKTGGLKMFVDMMASISTPNTIVLVATIIPGVISAYASSTGIVLPVFLPVVPDLVASVGGDMSAVFSGVCLGSLLVDSSPLSLLGAFVVGAATEDMDKRKLFNQLMAWGLSMAVVGAVVAWLIF